MHGFPQRAQFPISKKRQRSLVLMQKFLLTYPLPDQSVVDGAATLTCCSVHPGS